MIAQLRSRGADPVVYDGIAEQWIGADALLTRAAACGERLRLRIDRPALLVLLCDNTVASLVGYLAALQLEWPVALIDAAMPAEQRDAILARYRPAAVIGGAPDTPLPDLMPLGDGASPALHLSRVAGAPVAQGLALLLPTSGSTGSPKFVRLARTAQIGRASCRERV